MDPLAHRVAAHFVRRVADDTPAPLGLEDAVATVSAGIALVIAQSTIVSAPFFDEKEIRKFLSLRRQFHDQFVVACKTLGDAIEHGVLGSGAKPAAQGLKVIEHLSPAQDRQALVAAIRVLRGLKHVPHADVDPRVFKLIRHAGMVMNEDAPKGEEAHESGWRTRDRIGLLQDVIKLDVVPAPIRTLLRKVLKTKAGDVSEEAHEDAAPGAFFELDEPQKAAVRQKVQDLLVKRKAIFDNWPSNADSKGLEVEAARDKYKEVAAEIAEVQREAGLNVEAILRADKPVEPVDVVLKRESKNDPDGPTEWILKEVSEYVRRAGEWKSQEGKPLPRKRKENRPEPLTAKPKSIPMEFRKLLTLIGKARSFDTLTRVIQEAVDRKILSRDAVTDIQKMLAEAHKNIAVKEGIPLVPLTWEPTSPEDFQARHDTGEIRFSPDIPEEERPELLGRVSRAVSDLESVFGKGFCGKHEKKLAFTFGGSSSFMAKAHYFQYDDRRTWQPRVTFGEDYEGVLAHELSHYLDDMITHEVSLRENPEWAARSRRDYGQYAGPGGVGNTGVALEYVTDTSLQHPNDPVHKQLPELVNVLTAIRNAPDYKRWGDMTGNLLEFTGDKAVEKLTGMGRYDLPPDHPYKKALDAQYKSEVPPELLAECEKMFVQMQDGDSRKLTYYHSATEVWARMTEQYVYTKLARSGVSNPWLTWLQYDDPKYMDQDRFEKEMVPLYDKLFLAMRERKIIARRVLTRFLAGVAMGHARLVEDRSQG